ncbi:hypothetical protein EV121DRAFT_216370 [Schizophyllum commune]
MPIQDLPPELLEEIFVHCVPCGRGALYDEQDVKWIAPTQVCRQWRTIALACQRLWASAILFQKPFWTYTALRRAGNAPLTFDIDLKQSGTAFCAPILALYAEQIADLRISGDGAQMLATLAHFARDSAPRLDALALEVQSPRYSNDTAPCLPDIFQEFTRQRPLRLRTLELDFCYLALTSNLYAGVTTFVLRHPSRWWRIGLIHDLLQTMPHLQSLSIDRVYDMPRLRPSQALVLPQSLAHMRLVGDSRRATENQHCDFSSFVQSVQLTAKSWNFTCEAMDMRHVAVLLAILSDSVGSTPVGCELGPWRYHNYTHNRSNGVERLLVIRLWTMAPVCKSISLSFLRLPSSIDALRLLLEMLRILHIVDVNVHGCIEGEMDEFVLRSRKKSVWWKDNFPYVQVWTIDALPPKFLLHDILIRRMLSVGVGPHLRNRSAIYDKDGHVIQIFADLRCIRLEDIDLSVPIWSYHKAQVEQRRSSILPLILMIIWACAKRRHLKIPHSHVPRVVPKNCDGVDAGVVDALRGLTSVEWDGKGETSWTHHGDVRTSVLEAYIDMFWADSAEIDRRNKAILDSDGLTRGI